MSASPGCSFIFVIIKRISCDDIPPDFWVDLTVLGHFGYRGTGLHCSVSYHAKPIQYSIAWLEKWIGLSRMDSFLPCLLTGLL
ncbi:hypothetical protein OPV22_020737 [Ensete ventricosum]|uniref:Peptidase S1 domain-containing protein n=1 Tax=Ensete ventricosum TaxID=4639 RepID=A0AAV8QNR5_ENSVE|nr:hypothetical protein OPV22_020737 [Ensete ventricosum]